MAAITVRNQRALGKTVLWVSWCGQISLTGDQFRVAPICRQVCFFACLSALCPLPCLNKMKIAIMVPLVSFLAALRILTEGTLTAISLYPTN